jgi:hypothetical protein
MPQCRSAFSGLSDLSQSESIDSVDHHFIERGRKVKNCCSLEGFCRAREVYGYKQPDESHAAAFRKEDDSTR